MVPLERDEVVEGRDAVQLGGVNQAHEHVADPRAGERPVEQGVLAMQDGLLQGAFAEVVVQRRARHAQERVSFGQCLSMYAIAVPRPEFGSTRCSSSCWRN